ncbi:MAG: hypothetical protein ABIN91_23535 [Mucilaginibacter sp.]|uniref:hypothetical protein n=1 Tax=Mucilaginibacter sp. TaxID=1882438 RepID=UPI003266EBE3
MKKRSLLIVLLLSAVLLQFCKKSDSTDTTDTTTTTSTVLFNAYVNGTLWTPKTVSATLTYNATAKTKTFTCTATDTAGTHKVVLNLTQAATALDSTLIAQTYSDTTTFKPNYYTITSGVSKPVGSLKGAYVTISSIDVAKKLITGTFSFNTTLYTYDGSGNVVSITSNAVTSGQFNNLPYTFKKQ